MSKAKPIKVDESVDVQGEWEITGPSGELRFKLGGVQRALGLYAEHFGLGLDAVVDGVRSGRVSVRAWNERAEAGGAAGVHGHGGATDVPA